MSFGADLEANTLMTSLLLGQTFDIPVVDLSGPQFNFPGSELSALYSDVTRLTNEDLTTRAIGGTGAFDALMDGFKAHLEGEYNAGRITGAEYTKAYIALTESAMGNATQFLLGREQAFWAAQRGQLDAIVGRAEIELKKVQVATAIIEANTVKVNYAKTKLSLANEDLAYGISQFNLSTMLPKQAELLTAEILAAGKSAQLQDGEIALQSGRLVLQGKEVTLKSSEILLQDQQVLLVTSQVTKMGAETSLIGVQETKVQSERLLINEEVNKIIKDTLKIVAETSLTNSRTLLTDGEVGMVPDKSALLKEQIEVQRAQTMDTRVDGLTAIVGSVGKQKELYAQQITAYQRDSEVKAAKLFTDSWITQKTLDEGLLAPTGFTNASIDTVLTAVKANNNLT